MHKSSRIISSCCIDCRYALPGRFPPPWLSEDNVGEALSPPFFHSCRRYSTRYHSIHCYGTIAHAAAAYIKLSYPERA